MTLFKSLLVACGACAALSANAQTPPPDDAWHYEVILYGYLPDVGGTTTFQKFGVGGGIKVDASTILKHLQGVFMGMGEVTKGPFGLYTDVIYLDLGASKSDTRDISIGGLPIPVDASANLDYNLRGWVWTLAGTYRVNLDPRW